jgi:ribosomal protein S17E
MEYVTPPSNFDSKQMTNAITGSITHHYPSRRTQYEHLASGPRAYWPPPV